ncbi:hypothetical protein K493DRAFT_315514 [Basidiobolus meristosporus CBS 931.73]|uniref:Uncharacterized protein n=1 Tax=Basidiobolus meristosporus CBS 931.73 TaxID=1314790 RepID=A0A1Y1Y8P5_9FUNG|nr:hypothetical protein K493DRAFT_315514 [Basidiobolus meristosporus CBS 931.73]|eukprot:ORX94373.1 hypothetical protein K493DRAFT_315514 [Basidiobolus meristosporus CBS 931.73]
MYSPSPVISPFNAVPDSEPDLVLDSNDNYPEPDLTQSPPYVPPSPGPLPPLFSLPSPYIFEEYSDGYSEPYVPNPACPADSRSSNPNTPLSHSSVEWIGGVPKSPLGPYSYCDIEPIHLKDYFYSHEDQRDAHDNVDSARGDYDITESLYNRLVDQYEEQPAKRIKLSTDILSSSIVDADSKLRSSTVDQDMVAKCTPVGHKLLRGDERKFIQENGLYNAHSPSEFFKHKKDSL